MREIVTIQVGGFANFVGSHFWNFQDELLGLAGDPNVEEVFKILDRFLNMDTLYRTGETPQGIVSYTPRLLSIDLQGSLGSMSSRGTLYNESVSSSSDVVTWGGNVTTYASEPRKKNLFQKSLNEEEQENFSTKKAGQVNKREIQDHDIVESLESGVEYWTDYSKVHYHPQSLYELNGLWMDNREFNNYGTGRDVFSEGSRGEEITERLRFFVEECDQVQGFQFMVDDSGGFSPLAADILESIADEYVTKPVLLYNVRGPGSHMIHGSLKSMVMRKIHDAVSFSRLSSLCKLIVPIGLPSLSASKPFQFLSIKDEKPYHCSAIYAAALHSISLPFRLEPLGPAIGSSYYTGAIDIDGVIQTLSGQGRQNMVAILDAAMPAPPVSSGQQAAKLLHEGLQLLTPEVKENIEDLDAVESMTIHGALDSEGKPVSPSQVTEMINEAHEHSLVRLEFCHLSTILCPLPIPLPFPSIFGNLVGQHGEILSSPVSSSSLRGSLDVHSIPMAARLRSSSAVLPFLQSRLENLRKFAVARGAIGGEVFRSWGFGKDEVADMEESLSSAVSRLETHSQVSSDSD